MAELESTPENQNTSEVEVMSEVDEISEDEGSPEAEGWPEVYVSSYDDDSSVYSSDAYDSSELGSDDLWLIES